jgi:peptidoglycan hydrolase CwlO-like protein
MKIKYIFFLLSLIFSLLILLFPAFAQTTVDQDELDEKQEEIDKYEKRLQDLQSREKTLANEIEYVNDQITLSELKIQSSVAKIEKTRSEIEKLAADIGNLKDRIDKLIISIDYQQKILEARMRESYKSKDESVVILFGTNSLSTLIQKLEYLQVMEKHDNKLLDEMRKTKEAFTTQKRLFEEKKSEVEDLKKKLEIEKANLDAQKGNLEDRKREKQKLLELTQNDEQKYQKLLEDARRELNQIIGAVNVLKNSKATKVKKGNVIGVQGNTGYSFGDHLHFGIYKYSSFKDIDGWNWYYSNSVEPGKMLKKKTVYWDTGCEGARDRTVGSGDWSWPMSNPTITQGYGFTCWSNRYYGGKQHPAYDMAGPTGTPIFAVADGEAYACRNCLGDGGNGVFIFHDDGYMTLYWHLK